MVELIFLNIFEKASSPKQDTIAALIDIGPEMVKIWILDFEKKF